MFFDEYEEDLQNDKISDYEILEIKDDPKTLAYGLYRKITTYEDHYNRIQNKYKGLTVTWVILTFLGIGYLLSGYEKGIRINVLLIISFLCFLAAAGIFLLWFLDSGVYHKLIESIWIEGFKLEEKFDFLGKARHNTLTLHQHEKAPQESHGHFYLTFFIFFLIIAISSLSIYFFCINKWLNAVLLPFIFLLVFFFHKIKKKPLFFKKEED